MLLTPSGQVLFSAGTHEIGVYSQSGGPEPSWQPHIANSPSEIVGGRPCTIKGPQINGLSQTVSYGDEATMATNYPLVRMQNITSGNVRYCGTHVHSTMNVASGNSLQSTHFDIPHGIGTGQSIIVIVAKRILSTSLNVSVKT